MVEIPGGRALPMLFLSLIALAIVVGSSGCASDRGTTRTDFDPVYFGAQDSTVRFVVLGDTRTVLPSYDETPPIERFLYGSNSAGKTILRNPQGLALAGQRLLICDQGYQDVVAIDLVTGKSTLWCDRDHSPRCPVDLTVGPDSLVYIADTTRRAILVYDANGGFIEELTPDGGSPRQFRPAAVRHDGRYLLVGNLISRRIERFDVAERRWLEPLTLPADQGALLAPTGLAVTTEQGLLIADGVRGSVFRMNKDGTWLPAIGSPGRGPGQFVRPKQITSTPDGLAFAVDAGRQSVLVFDRAGRFVCELHGRNQRWPGWTLPTGVLWIPGEALPVLNKQLADRRLAQPDSYLIVSDSLGAQSLTVVGIMTSSSKDSSDGR